MSKQPDRVRRPVTEAEIDKLCEIAKISDAGRAIFSEDFRKAVERAVRRGRDYRSPDAAAPIIAGADTVSAAALTLLDVIDQCDPVTRSNIQEVLFDGTIREIRLAVDDLRQAAETISYALNRANGKIRKSKGRPSKKIGDPGLSAADLFAFESFFYAMRAGGWLSINETTDSKDRNGTAAPFFKACEPLLPFPLQTDAYRLRDLRAWASKLLPQDKTAHGE